MNKYIDAGKLKVEIERRKAPFKKDIEDGVYPTYLCALMDFEDLITSLQEEQQKEQPEYGYLSTEYVPGRKPRWSVGDVLAYYVCTSNEEGEYPLGKIVNVEFDEEDGWVYTFEDESMQDEQSLFEEEVYKKN